METNQDFKDLFKCLNDAQVEYLIVGAHAVVYYASPRFTKNLDIWISPTPENAGRVWQALSAFGAPLQGVSLDDFTQPDMVYQIGIEPNRVDILMGIAGLTFPDAWPGRVTSTYAGIPVAIIGKADLIKAKNASGRPQDQIDIDHLMDGGG